MRLHGRVWIVRQSWDRQFYAIDVFNGELKWSFRAKSAISSTAAIASDGSNTVYFGSYDQRLYALDSLSGELKWSVLLGGQCPVVLCPCLCLECVW
jgi:outer membrane protein assembly factor BamB